MGELMLNEATCVKQEKAVFEEFDDDKATHLGGRRVVHTQLGNIYIKHEHNRYHKL